MDMGRHGEVVSVVGGGGGVEKMSFLGRRTTVFRIFYVIYS